MLGLSDKFPDFKVKATIGKSIEDIKNIDEAFIEINNQSFEGKWLVVFFYPKDFTFVCPTEIAAFGDLNSDFADRDTQILGASIDSEYVHLAWRKQASELHHLPFPLLADTKRALTSALGILDKVDGVAQRATYIVDPQGIIRFVMVSDMNVGRNPKEVLRVLDALQTDELCPCNWNKGDETIQAA